MHKIVSGPDPDDPITHLPHTTAMPKPTNRIKQTKEKGKIFSKSFIFYSSCNRTCHNVSIPCCGRWFAHRRLQLLLSKYFLTQKYFSY